MRWNINGGTGFEIPGRRHWHLAQEDDTGEPHRLTGQLVWLNGFGLNLTALRVTWLENTHGGGQQDIYSAADRGEYEALCMLDDTHFQTHRVEDFPGEWIVYGSPVSG